MEQRIVRRLAMGFVVLFFPSFTDPPSIYQRRAVDGRCVSVSVCAPSIRWILFRNPQNEEEGPIQISI